MERELRRRLARLSAGAATTPARETRRADAREGGAAAPVGLTRAGAARRRQRGQRAARERAKMNCPFWSTCRICRARALAQPERCHERRHVAVELGGRHVGARLLLQVATKL